MLYKPKAITFHCTATENGKDVPNATITDWHLKRGFRTIGYHFVISPGGEIRKGREITQRGAHVKGYNKLGRGQLNVGVALCGNDRFTLLQFRRASELVDMFQKQHGVAMDMVFGHREFARGKKDCPNFRISDFMLWHTGGNQELIVKYLLPGLTGV